MKAMSEQPSNNNVQQWAFDNSSFAIGLVVGSVAGNFVSKRPTFGRVLGSLARERQDQQNALAMRQLSNIQSSLQRLEKTLPESESRIGSRLQAQERHISEGMTNHYSRLHKSLATVHAYGQSLVQVTGKIDDLQSIFHSPRTRGIIGEMQMESLIRDVWPPGTYAFQSRLSNGSRPDCMLKLPPPIGNVAIDSKFPLDAFLELQQDPNGTESGAAGPTDKQQVRKNLSKHLSDHVRTIASKYIIPGETADAAILFLPSEAIFAEVVEHHQHAVTEAFRDNVWIASPTTLMAILTTMRAAVRDVTVSRQIGNLMQEVRSMEADIDRLTKRSDDVEKHFEKARESLRQMNISTEKIARRRHNMASLSVEEAEALLEDNKPGNNRADEAVPKAR